MNLFQSIENKKFDSNAFITNKCDLLVISINYINTGNCYWGLVFNPRLDTITEFELMYEYCSSPMSDVPQSILNCLKNKSYDLQIHSPDFVLQSILKASNPKLIQVSL